LQASAVEKLGCLVGAIVAALELQSVVDMDVANAEVSEGGAKGRESRVIGVQIGRVKVRTRRKIAKIHSDNTHRSRCSIGIGTVQAVLRNCSCLVQLWSDLFMALPSN